jgi:hypothetical protein
MRHERHRTYAPSKTREQARELYGKIKDLPEYLARPTTLLVCSVPMVTG